MIPTPSGFQQLGDIRPGDFVFGSDGEPRVVLAESEIVHVAGYRLTFDDGSTVLANDEHLWKTLNAKELGQLTTRTPEWRAARRAKRPSRALANPSKGKYHQQVLIERNRTANPAVTLPLPEGTVRTTREIVDTLTVPGGRANHAIPVAASLEIAERDDLLVDPYVLGAWLGDGFAASGRICGMDDQVFIEVARDYEAETVQFDPERGGGQYRVANYPQLRDDLKALDLLNNKHVPHGYLWGSVPQRLALLQGLMDTDGNVSKKSVEFTNTNQNLTEAVAHLARSLGMKVRVREGRATLYGKDCGPKWSVKFAANQIVFRIPRKAQTQLMATRRTTQFRYITEAKRIAAVDMKCLKVSSPDHLFLVTEHLIPTHNSEVLLAGATQYVDDYPSSALLLRRTFRDLDKPGGLMFRARQWFHGTDAHWDGANHRWMFPSGASVNFGYLEHEGDELKYQSSEYQYCVRTDTLIRMGDETWKPINAIQPGELVDTLIGPKRVKRSFSAGTKPVVRIDTAYGFAYVSATHPLLTAFGWASPEALRPTRFHGVDNTGEAYWELSRAGVLPREFQRADLEQVRELARRTQDRTDLLVMSASARDGRTGYGAFGGEHQESLPPQPWSVRLMLHEPAARSTGLVDSDVALDEMSGYEAPSSPLDYRFSDGSHDAQYLLVSGAGQAFLPSQDDVGGQHPLSTLVDGRVNTQRHNPMGEYSYAHPYTNQQVEAHAGVLPVSASIRPAGEDEVWDLEVEDASHYVAYPGIISRNCGFDELTHFPEHQYLYLFSRLRRLADSPVPLRMRGATNPGGPGHEWVRKRWTLPNGTDDPERVVVPSFLRDNPFLDHEEYEKGLELLGPVTKAQLLEGDWSATATGGFFDTSKFRIIPWDEVPRAQDFSNVLRYWDLGTTEPTELNPDPDYTVGLKIGMMPSSPDDPHIPSWYVFDVDRFRGGPSVVEQRVKANAMKDGKNIPIWIEKELGAAGVHLVSHYARNVLNGFQVRGLKVQKTKEERAAQAAARVGETRVLLIEGEWIDDFVAECAVFPMGMHDDQVDTLGYGMIALEREAMMVSQGKVSRRGAEVQPVRRGRRGQPDRAVGW